MSESNTGGASGCPRCLYIPEFEGTLLEQTNQKIAWLRENDIVYVREECNLANEDCERLRADIADLEDQYAKECQTLRDELTRLREIQQHGFEE